VTRNAPHAKNAYWTTVEKRTRGAGRGTHQRHKALLPLIIFAFCWHSIASRSRADLILRRHDAGLFGFFCRRSARFAAREGVRAGVAQREQANATFRYAASALLKLRAGLAACALPLHPPLLRTRAPLARLASQPTSSSREQAKTGDIRPRGKTTLLYPLQGRTC